MHVGRCYRLFEFLVWTRRQVYAALLWGMVPVSLYSFLGAKWLAIPWIVVGLIGTAAAFIVGFHNVQTYARTVEAQQIWAAILSASRVWGLMCRDYVKNGETTRQLVYRHLAWATALRYQLRRPRLWESLQGDSANSEYQATYYSIPERETPLQSELETFLSAADLTYACAARNKALRVLGLQSQAIKRLYENGEIAINFFIELEKGIGQFLDYQAKSERIKNLPYPRQYAIVSAIFVTAFCVLLPFGLLHEFDALNAVAPTWLRGHMVWFVVPFSAVISWLYLSLMQVGKSTENPFEGSANDVPISQTCRMIEVELRDLLGEADLPPLLEPKNGIIL